MTTRPTPAPGAATTAAPGTNPAATHPVGGTRTVIAKGRPGATCTLRFAIRTNDMDTKQNPREQHPGGKHNSDGGTRAGSSLPAGTLLDAVVARLLGMSDGRLAEFSASLDAELARAGCLTADANDLVAVAAAARLTLRRRQEAAAQQRATALVHALISTTENE